MTTCRRYQAKLSGFRIPCSFQSFSSDRTCQPLSLKPGLLQAGSSPTLKRPSLTDTCADRVKAQLNTMSAENRILFITDYILIV